MAGGYQVEGLSGLLRALGRCDKATAKLVRDRLRAAGELVRRDAARRFAPYDAKSAGGYRVVVRMRGVSVEQRLRKTTGQHPAFGALQMRRALLPGVNENLDKIETEMGHVLEDLEGIFAGGVNV